METKVKTTRSSHVLLDEPFENSLNPLAQMRMLNQDSNPDLNRIHQQLHERAENPYGDSV